MFVDVVEKDVTGLPDLRAPVVAPDAFVNLEDRHAQKVTALLVKAIGERVDGKAAAALNALRAMATAGPGTPKAQIKMFSKIRDVYSEAIVAARLRPGKRGKFSISVDFIRVAAPMCLVNGAGSIYEKNDAGSWVYFQHVEVSPTTSRRTGSVRVWDAGTITLHAIMRLCQRGGLSSAEQIYSSMRSVWMGVSIAEVATFRERAKHESGVWVAPLIWTDENLFAVIEGPGPHSPQDQNLFVVKTFLTREMISPDLLPAIDRGVEMIRAEIKAQDSAAGALPEIFETFRIQ